MIFGLRPALQIQVISSSLLKAWTTNPLWYPIYILVKEIEEGGLAGMEKTTLGMNGMAYQCLPG